MLLQPRLLPRFLSISTKPFFSPFSPRASHLTTLPLPIIPNSDLDLSVQNPITLPLQKLFVPPDTDLSSDAKSAHSRVLTGSNIVLGPYARDSQVTSAEYVKSSVRTVDCPSDGLPEFALVGRSNVGKSSLLNSLVRKKNLALTSKKPGGYGYASAPKDSRLIWEEFTKDYFLKRETLVSVFLLIDASIPAKQIDLEYASWLGRNQRRIREAYWVLKLAGIACIIRPVYPTFWLSRFFADMWMLFPKEEEYIEWFYKAGFKDFKLKRIGPRWYHGVCRYGLILLCTGVKRESGDSPLQLGPKEEDVSKPVNPFSFLMRLIFGTIAVAYYVLDFWYPFTCG